MSDNHATLEDTPSDLLDALQRRANDLLAELRAYQACLRAHSKQKEVEIRTFKRGVESEVKTLTAASSQRADLSRRHLTDFEAEELESKRLHALRSSNLPFYEAVWTTARQCDGIVALGKRVFLKDNYLDGRTGSHPDALATSQHNPGKKSAVVDIVAQNGLEWIKVSTVTGKRLLYEMAKEGWESYLDRSDSDDVKSDEEDGVNCDSQDQSAQLELVKLAKVLYAASRGDRVRFRHPRVQFILPKVNEGIFDDVDAVIADIRSLGITVRCGNSGSDMVNELSSLQILNLSASPHENDFTHLLPAPPTFSPLPTPTLNIDCTILLALISDISHIPPSQLPLYPNHTSGHYHKAITKQISNETATPLLPSDLYRLLGNRTLVCTSQAAQRMREIVQTMGTTTETARTDIMLAEKSHLNDSPDTLRTALSRVSCHPVPYDLRLPIRVIDFEYDKSDNAAPTPADAQVMHRLTQTMNLSTINSSVFLYGWQQDIVTVTSNRSVATALVRQVNDILDEQEHSRTTSTNNTTTTVKPITDTESGEEAQSERDDFHGPSIYVCETARSLIGKQKP